MGYYDKVGICSTCKFQLDRKLGSMGTLWVKCNCEAHVKQYDVFGLAMDKNGGFWVWGYTIPEYGCDYWQGKEGVR